MLWVAEWYEGERLKRLSTIAAALVLSCVAVAMLAGSLRAQSAPRVYDACRPAKDAIKASALPAIVDQDRCPVEGRTIRDNGVGAVVPRPGESVLAEGTSPDGGQHLIVSNPVGDGLIVEAAGDEAEQDEPLILARRSSSGCGDRYYNNWDTKLYNYNRWYVNRGSIPSRMSDSRVIKAIRKGGNNIKSVDDPCGVRDRVKGQLRYQGNTSRSVDMNTSGTCNANDGKSVVGFGDLPGSYTGKACVYSLIQNGPNRVISADIRLNKEDYRWTTKVTRSCGRAYDVESTITHERGHHFGLGEASPSRHPNLTMNSSAVGPCRTFKRSLGKGDAIGLNRKY